MKSIQNQYRDLKEGKMSQANFMRNVRMTFPHLVTNVTSFNDSVRILKNKGLLSETKTKLHPNQIHPQELRMGIQVEMEHTDDPKKAEKIALDHLAENPFYYTALKLSGVESPSAPKAKAPAKAKAKKEVTELVDKDNAMKPVKGIEKVKASANKAHKETNKGVKGVEELTHAAKKAKGIKQVMSPTGGKMKTIRENLEKFIREVIEEYFDGRDNLDASINENEGFEEWEQALYDLVMREADLEMHEIAINNEEIKQYWEQGKTPEEVYFDIWEQDAGNYYNVSF